jgi:hypothetical protein
MYLAAGIIGIGIDSKHYAVAATIQDRKGGIGRPFRNTLRVIAAGQGEIIGRNGLQPLRLVAEVAGICPPGHPDQVLLPIAAGILQAVINPSLTSAKNILRTTECYHHKKFRVALHTRILCQTINLWTPPGEGEMPRAS